MSKRIGFLLLLSLAFVSTSAAMGGQLVDVAWIGAIDAAASSRPLSFTCSSVSGIPTSECEALVELYGSAGGPDWKYNDGWLASTDPCGWFGVSCQGGHVSGLDLYSNRLSGHIPPALGSLPYLETLWLSGNQLSGSIPSELGQLGNLRRVDFYDNQLEGSIPPELGRLIHLSHLDLSGNRLTGSIPSDLGGLANVERLALSGNQLSGSIPAELGQLAQLRDLALYDNQLEGSIPPELGRLINLQDLDLADNRLTGSIPPELGDLVGLSYFDLAGNQLSKEIPPELGRLTSLDWLYLDNNQLGGGIPPELGELVNLWDLDLSDNDLSGSIPPELGDLANLWHLDLSDNRLSGRIPGTFGDLVGLRKLFLDNNQLSGLIPSALAGSSLKAFWFNETNLCEPSDPVFQTWLNGIDDLRRMGTHCGDSLIASRKMVDGTPWLYLYDTPTGFWSPVSSRGSNASPIPGGDVAFMFGLDHDGDGTDEIAAVKKLGGVPYLYIYSQPTSWEGTSSVVAANYIPIPAGDIRFMFGVDHDGDGIDEIAAVKVLEGTPYLYIYTSPSGMWTSVSRVAANFVPIPGGDVKFMFSVDHDGDGIDEIACVKLLPDGHRYLYIYTSPSGMWTPVSTVASNFMIIPGGDTRQFFSVDHNRDGVDEIAVVKVVDGIKYLYIYTSPSGMWTPVDRVAANRMPIVSGDLLNVFGLKRGP